MRKTSTYARKRAHRKPANNPVKQALVVANMQEDIDRLKRACGIHAFMGDDVDVLTNLAGRLVFITCYAIGLHGLGDTPEARILMGTANALGELAEDAAGLEQRRGAIQAGLAAIDRIMPKLNPTSLAEGALKLEYMLNNEGLWSQDVVRAVKGEI